MSPLRMKHLYKIQSFLKKIFSSYLVIFKSHSQAFHRALMFVFLFGIQGEVPERYYFYPYLSSLFSFEILETFHSPKCSFHVSILNTPQPATILRFQTPDLGPSNGSLRFKASVLTRSIAPSNWLVATST